MNEWMKRHKESLKYISEPIMLSQMTKTMDLRGLMEYAKEKGVKVAQLSEKEKMSFVNERERV